MTTDVCPPQCPDYIFQWLPQEPIPDWQIKYDEQFHHTTHSTLQVIKAVPGPPQPEVIDVKVFDASKGTYIPFTLKSTDTMDILNKKYLRLKPELVGKTLHLAYNGKPVSVNKSLSELGVKPGAMFITYQKCPGG